MAGVVLLVETRYGDWVAVEFQTAEHARNWEATNDVNAKRVARVVTREQAQTESV